MNDKCECSGDFFPGLHAIIDDEMLAEGLIPAVERHDECAIYEGDLEAAAALAAHLKATRGETWIVKYYQANQNFTEDQQGEERIFDGKLNDGVLIQYATDPWLERLDLS